MATCNNLSATGRLGRSAGPTFLFWDPLHIAVINGVRKLKFGTLVGIYEVLCIKICLLVGVWVDQQPPFFILRPLHISETNKASKLKFGILVVIYKY